MALVTQDIPNLSNGVSQQPALLRSPSQGTAQDNCQSSVVDGMRRRPPLVHVAKAAGGQFGSAAFHVVDRDAATKYALVIAGGSLRAFDLLTGAERTVNIQGGASYLVSSDPSSAFKAVTAADYTFLLNRGAVAGMTPDVSPTRPTEALLFFHAADYAERFTVTIGDGTWYAELPPVTTNDTTRNWLKTNTLAGVMGEVLIQGHFSSSTGSNAPSGSGPYSLPSHGYYVEVRNSCIRIYREDGLDFSISTSDGAGGDHLRCFKGTVQNFSDLPKQGIPGFAIRVTGSPDDEGGGYWVQYQESFANPGAVAQPSGGNTGDVPVPIQTGGGSPWPGEQPVLRGGGSDGGGVGDGGTGGVVGAGGGASFQPGSIFFDPYQSPLQSF